MKRKLFIIMAIMLLMIPLGGVKVSADIGPKPSVTIEFKGMKNQTYYVTLLSKYDSSGPWSLNSNYKELPSGQHSLNKIFASYQDTDGYYYLSYVKDCTNTNLFEWTYWPPDEFKILLYLPETKEFIVSPESYTRYAFHSTYTATVTGDTILLETSPSTTAEFLALLLRILCTLAIELCLALVFSYCKKQQLIIITLTNIATQLFLNLMLFKIITTDQSWYTFYFYYAVLELCIIVSEGFIYQHLLNRYSLFTESKRHPWLYSLTANIASFFLGLLLSFWIPFLD